MHRFCSSTGICHCVIRVTVILLLIVGFVPASQAQSSFEREPKKVVVYAKHDIQKDSVIPLESVAEQVIFSRKTPAHTIDCRRELIGVSAKTVIQEGQIIEESNVNLNQLQRTSNFESHKKCPMLAFLKARISLKTGHIIRTGDVRFFYAHVVNVSPRWLADPRMVVGHVVKKAIPCGQAFTYELISNTRFTKTHTD